MMRTMNKARKVVHAMFVSSNSLFSTVHVFCFSFFFVFVLQTKPDGTLLDSSQWMEEIRSMNKDEFEKTFTREVFDKLDEIIETGEMKKISFNEELLW